MEEKTMVSLVFAKLKQFRFTVPSLILLVLASYRTFTSGDSIQLVGVCAAIVPFICQFKRSPNRLKSILPLSNGVTIAVAAPLNSVIDFSPFMFPRELRDKKIPRKH